MMPDWFADGAASHAHSLETLTALYEYDDFMQSIGIMADMGYGNGYDLEWWATRTTRDDTPKPLNIKCYGIDRNEHNRRIGSLPNVSYIHQDFEQEIVTGPRKKFDVIYCHDSFQYAVNPLQTLRHWYHAISDGGMLVLVLPQTTNLEYNRQKFEQRDGVYFHWTMVSVMHALAVSGFDCSSGFFLKKVQDPWIHAVVYKSQHEPLDLQVTRWYDLVDRQLLPVSAVDSIKRWGFLRQQDLLLPWLDRMLYGMSDH